MSDTELLTRLRRIADEHEIRNVIYRYCRALDRFQWDEVRDCYHPDATDDHGDYRGGVDGFIELIKGRMPRLVSSSHFIGNVLVEVDGDSARAESYAISLSRLSSKGDRPESDQWTGFRYVDDFERRGGEWRIARRVCLFDWTRSDPVGPGWTFTGEFLRGVPGRDDLVFASRLPDPPEHRA
jgi:ketosteroid isomerase-like protein